MLNFSELMPCTRFMLTHFHCFAATVKNGNNSLMLPGVKGQNGNNSLMVPGLNGQNNNCMDMTDWSEGDLLLKVLQPLCLKHHIY